MNTACEICGRQNSVIQAKFELVRIGEHREFEMIVMLCENCASLTKSEAIGVMQGETSPHKKREPK